MIYEKTRKNNITSNMVFKFTQTLTKFVVLIIFYILVVVIMKSENSV